MRAKMKITLLTFLFVTLAMPAYTQEAYAYYTMLNEPDVPEQDLETQAATVYEEPEEPEEQEAPARKRGISSRTFEISVNANANASNNIVTAGDIFQETAEIYLDNLFSGTKVDFSAAVEPSININIKDRWGFGLDIAHINAYGNLTISGSLIDGLAEAEDDTFGVGAAVYADILAVPVFFHINKLNNLMVRIRPAAYVPVLHAVPGIVYNRSGGVMSVDYDMRVYSIVSLQGIESGIADPSGIMSLIGGSMGYDFSLGFEYPLLSKLNLGVDIVNIPLYGGRLNHYMHLQDRVSFDMSKISFDDLMNGKLTEDAYNIPDTFEPVYGSETIRLFRPFKTVFYANYRPFGKDLFAVIPSLGLSYNKMYPQKWGPEGGVSVRLDLGNIFITTLGINYNDRIWKNSIDFSLNFRVIQLDIGASFQSPNFAKSFQGAGAGVNVGLKLGF